MVMRLLEINDDVKAKCKALIEKAAAEPTPYEDNKRLVEQRAAGQHINLDNAKFTIELGGGFIVTYTHEHQREDLVCRHISVSAAGAKPRTGPSPPAVMEILKLFDFKNGLGQMPGWVSVKDDGSLIVEFLEPLDGDLTKLLASR